MSSEPRIVLRCNRLALYTGVFWLVQGVLGFAGPDPSIFWDSASLVLGVFWFGYHLTSSITITQSVVIVRRGLLQDAIATQTFIDHEIKKDQSGKFGGSFTLNGERLRLPFAIRHALIIESIMLVKGIERPMHKEQLLHGRERSLF